jgi:hypothetical protein
MQAENKTISWKISRADYGKRLMHIGSIMTLVLLGILATALSSFEMPIVIFLIVLTLGIFLLAMAPGIIQYHKLKKSYKVTIDTTGTTIQKDLHREHYRWSDVSSYWTQEAYADARHKKLRKELTNKIGGGIFFYTKNNKTISIITTRETHSKAKQIFKSHVPHKPRIYTLQSLLLALLLAIIIFSGLVWVSIRYDPFTARKTQQKQVQSKQNEISPTRTITANTPAIIKIERPTVSHIKIEGNKLDPNQYEANKVIWEEENTGTQFWGWKWAATNEGKTLEQVKIPSIADGNYRVHVENKNGTTEGYPISISWKGIHGSPAQLGPVIANIQPQNASPGEQVIIKGIAFISYFRTPEGNIKETLRKHTLIFRKNPLCQTHACSFKTPYPQIVIDVEAKDNNTITIELPTTLEKNKLYFIQLQGRTGQEIMYTTGQ